MIKKTKCYLCCMFLLSFLCMTGCSVKTGEDVKEEQINTEIENAVVDIEIETEEPEHKITLMMIGDNLLHPSVIRTGYMEDGSRNYSHLFMPIKECLV